MVLVRAPASRDGPCGTQAKSPRQKKAAAGTHYLFGPVKPIGRRCSVDELEEASEK
jgi:hypothetical protein